MAGREPCRHPTSVPLKVNRGSRPHTEERVLDRLGWTPSLDGLPDSHARGA